eukprot:SM007100S21250  [mRNA]  locus=s7100:22:776:+ [translate_table: standard]
MDHGRCTALTFADPLLYADMFFLQLAGDKLARSVHAHPNRTLQAVAYNHRPPLGGLGRGLGLVAGPNGSVLALPDIPCYRPDRDIVIPPFVPPTALRPRAPWDGPRPFIAVFRFAPQHHHGMPVRHHGHETRAELYDLFAGSERRLDNKQRAWSFGVKDDAATLEDYRRAKFCVSPPGHSQWTTRPIKAILCGCIPVTFLRQNDHPFQDELDWSKISINI